MIDRSRNVAFLAATILMLASHPVQAADLVVLESNTPALRAGQLVDDASLDLPAGATITVLSANGLSTTVTGPHSGALPAAEKTKDNSRLSAALSRLIVDNATTSSSLGAVRSIETAANVPMGTLSAEHVGAQCVVANALPAIQRDQAGSAETASLKQIPGDEAEIVWARGQETTDWPATIPIVDGGIYLLRRTDRTIPLKIELHVLADDTAAHAFTVAWAAAKDCTLQAKGGLADLSQ